MTINPDLAEDMPTPDDEIEPVPSEEEDHAAALPAYEILTYPADFTLEVLVDKWRKGQIVIPHFQRRFVWTQVQASKLIESFLIGLPVPAIFLYAEPTTNDWLVVDGQQRLKTIAYFFEGYFGEEAAGSRTVFRLTGLDEGNHYLGKTYDDFKGGDTTAFNKLNDSVLRAFVIRQLDPNDDTSIYHIFERLNTGGTFLNPQEIRNCIHHGPFNDALIRLNDLTSWRRIFGRKPTDRRQRDVELILRFLALFENSRKYEKPMKDFLNKFMATNRRPDEASLDAFREIFERTATQIEQSLGQKPFHIRAGLNAAVFDSVFVTVARHIASIPPDLRERYSTLIHDPRYLALVTSATTDKDVVQRRLNLAEETLIG